MIPKLSIIRGQFSPEGTFGHAYCNASPVSGFSFRTLELPWKDNKPGASCIPVGTYYAIPYFSPRFGREVLLFQDVPGRQMIEMHPGNFAGDETLGYYSNVDGCILPGFGVGKLETPDGKMQLAVMRSRAAMNAIMEAINSFNISEVIVTISNGIDATPLDFNGG